MKRKDLFINAAKSVLYFLLKPSARSVCISVFVALLVLDAKAQPSSQQIYLSCLTNFETYAETIWHTSATIPDSGYWGDGGSTGNGGIRGNGGIAVAYAVLCLAQPDDPKFSNRLARIRQSLNYEYNTHVTGAYNTTKGNHWGWNGASGDWQTPEWSASMGLACILVQKQSAHRHHRRCVRTVVVSEANHRAAIAPPSGHVSDTKAEENAWQGNILALAAAWMSTSNNAPTWLTAAKKYLANTYTISNPNGDPLASWLTTVTLYNDWALENHGFYHPTYEMVAGMSSGDSLLMAKMADTNIAAQFTQFAEHNVLAVWTNNLSGMVMDSGDFAYPAGLDWELHDYEQYSFIAWMAAYFNDPVARWDDLRLAQLTRYRQQVNGNGEFVGPGGGGFYREAVEARRVAISWLHWNFADHPTGPASAPAPALENLTDVAILTCRGTNGFVSISYGPQSNGSPARIMAVIEPPAAGFPSNTIVTTPRLPGIIGLGAMGSPTGGRLVNLTTNGNGFFAELQLINGTNGTTEVFFNNTGDSVGIVEVPHPAASFLRIPHAGRPASAPESKTTRSAAARACSNGMIIRPPSPTAAAYQQTCDERLGLRQRKLRHRVRPGGLLELHRGEDLQPSRRGARHIGVFPDEFAHAALRGLFPWQKRAANFQSRRADQLEHFRHKRDFDFSRRWRKRADFRAAIFPQPI